MTDLAWIDRLDDEGRAKLLAALDHHLSRTHIDDFYLDEGPLRRELYPQHMRFFALGTEYRSRGFIAANRVGKTEGAGGYELTMHLTGKYPEWWPGRRFTHPISAWAAGDTRQTTRDILQYKLFGKPGFEGTGLVPADCIIDTTAMPGVTGAYGEVQIRHASGGTSLLSFKSFDQGRKAFQGTEQHVILLDEESDSGIRNECLLRLATTRGVLMETFTPLKGLTPIVLEYMPGELTEDRAVLQPEQSRAMVMAGWDDVPHLDAKVKAEILADTPPHLRDARTKGIPSMGAGAIFTVPLTDFEVAPFRLPAHWKRVFGMDVGWKRTAIVWGAIDPDTGVTYLYAEYYRGQAEPAVHAEGWRRMGAWIPGVIDPASRGRTQDDGKQLLRIYRDIGMRLTPADNAVEAGLHDVWAALSSGMLKVFSTMSNWKTEYRMYRRDENGKIVKENDHLMDATRYLMRSGRKVAAVRPVAREPIIEGFRPLDPAVGY